MELKYTCFNAISW